MLGSALSFAVYILCDFEQAIFGFSLFTCKMTRAQIIFKFLFGYKNFVSAVFTGEQQQKETF